MNKRTFFALAVLMALFHWSATTQTVTVDRVEPPFWWTGMTDPHLQLLICGTGAGNTLPRIHGRGVILDSIIRVENPNYLFLDLTIPKDTRAGWFTIDLYEQDSLKASWQYELRDRRAGSASRKGFDASDVIYLLMPDRFANGDSTNDNVPGMFESCDRSNPDGRHGGDLLGVSRHLDDIIQLGATALWMNPFVENNNPSYSYHGYAISDFYQTDPRIGTNEQFAELVQECHQKGLKVIMDQILNHASNKHWLILDPPSPAWIHTFNEFTRTNYRASALMDPYASEYDRILMLTGWFDTHMPDLNQYDPLLLNYFIQNSIWWVEFTDLDGIRLDTQPYPYKEAVAAWSKRIMNEYPDFNIVGEAWLQQEALTAYFQKDSPTPDGYNSFMPAVTDFPRYYALTAALNEKESYTGGMSRLYLTLVHDYLYADPYNKLIFCDNHDLSRFFSVMGEDIRKFKMGLTYLMTTTGIPMIYYGTEILMTGFENQGHGFIRKDYPGGWASDSLDAFTKEGRTAEQNEAYTFLQTLLKWRQGKEVIHSGKMVHFVPENGIYVYFRMNDHDTVMVILNNEEKEQTLQTSRFAECIGRRGQGKDPITQKKLDDISSIVVPAKSAMILELFE